MFGGSALLQISCNRLLNISWLQDHLLPCPFKYLTGIDCPGCGFQRAVLALLQGHFAQSGALYPPLIPLILFWCYGLADRAFKLDNAKGTQKKTLFLIVGSIVLVSYGFKMWGIYQRYTLSTAAAM